MEHYVMNKIGRTFVLKFDQGDYVLESIKELIAQENIQNGVVVSGIGTLDESVMHMITTTDYPVGEYFDRRKNEPIELVAIQGIIADGVPHLHTVISDCEKAYAGHLEEGCRILYLGEVVIIEYSGVDLKRVKNQYNVPQLQRK